MMQSKNSQDVTIGNPQERLHFNIGYLIGIIDGEGAYQLGPDKIYYSPVITINNTDDKIIKLTTEALTLLGIPYHVWKPKLFGKERRYYARILIKGIKNVKLATDIILKYPSAKNERAQLLNDFCNHRLLIAKGHGSKNQFKTKYSNIEIQFKERLRELNSKYKGAKSPETIRLTA
jgi:hypothetical protein